MEASTPSEVNFQILANSRIPLSISSGDEVESAISRFTSLGKLQSVKGMTIQKAFGLDGAEPIQNVVKVVATDEEMRNVFLNITEVQEFKRQLMTEGDIHGLQSEAHPDTVQFDEQRRRVRREEHHGVGQEDEGHRKSCSKKEEEKDLKFW